MGNQYYTGIKFTFLMKSFCVVLSKTESRQGRETLSGRINFSWQKYHTTLLGKPNTRLIALFTLGGNVYA